MSNMCKVFLIGRLGADPETKTYGKQNKLMASFSIAVSQSYSKDAKTNWHRVKVFGRQAEFCQLHLNKGDLCCVEGKLNNFEYERDGNKIKVSEVIADRISLLGRSAANRARIREEEMSEAIPY